MLVVDTCIESPRRKAQTVPMPALADEVLKLLLDRCRQEHQAWINRKGAGYLLPSDGTIMGVVGGFITEAGHFVALFFDCLGGPGRES
jgi:hypothetical protein